MVLWAADVILLSLFVGHHHTKNIAWEISSAILILVGFIDDRTGLKPLVKLAGQPTAVALFCYTYHPEGFTFATIQFPFPVALVMFVIFCVALVNAFNLIDGLDGL